MGGGNPVEDAIDETTDFVKDATRIDKFDPETITENIVDSSIDRAGGATSEVPGIKDDVDSVAGGVAGEISGKNDRLRQEAENKKTAAIAKEERQQKEREVAAEQNKEENLDRARVSRGRSRSRTLLTGGQGVQEEEDKNITRRTLLGS